MRNVLARTVVLVFGLMVLTVLPASVHAQSLTAEYGWTQAGIDDVLERPTGFGASLDFPLVDRLSVRIAVRHHTESLSIQRSPCTGLPPPDADCRPQPFEGDADFTTVGAGLVVKLPRPISMLEPRLYAMGLVADVDVNFQATETDREIAPFTPDDPTVGLAGGGSLYLSVNEYVGVKTKIGAQYIRFGTCGLDAWFPFCDSQVMPRVSLGAELQLGPLFEAVQ